MSFESCYLRSAGYECLWVRRDNKSLPLVTVWFAAPVPVCIGEIPQGEREAVLRLPPTNSAQVTVEFRIGGQPIAQQPFLTASPPIAPRLAVDEHGLPRVRWDPGNWQRVILRGHHWQSGQLKPIVWQQEHPQPLVKEYDVETTSLPLVPDRCRRFGAMELLWTPQADQGAQGITEVLRLGPPSPTVTLHFEHRQVPHGSAQVIDSDFGSMRLSPGEQYLVLRIRNGGSKKIQAPKIYWVHKTSQQAHDFVLRGWDYNGQIVVNFPGIQTRDVIRIDYDRFDTRVVQEVLIDGHLESRTRHSGSSSPEYMYVPLHRGSSTGTLSTTERISVEDLGFETEWGRYDNSAASLQSLHEAFHRTQAAELLQDAEFCRSIDSLPWPLMARYLDTRGHAHFPAVMAQLATPTSAPVGVLHAYLDRPQDVHLLLSEENLRRLIRKAQLRLQSIWPLTTARILAHSVNGVDHRSKIEDYLHNNDDVELIAWTRALLDSSASASWLRVRACRNWRTLDFQRSSDMATRLERITRLVEGSVDALRCILRELLVPHEESTLWQAAQQCYGSLSAALAEFGRVDDILQAEEDLAQFSHVLGQHLEQVRASRPLDPAWEILHRVPRTIGLDNLSEAIRVLLRWSQGVVAPDENHVVPHDVELPPWLEADRRCLAHYRTSAEDRRNKLCRVAGWCHDLLSNQKLPKPDPQRPLEFQRITGTLKAAWQRTLAKLPEFEFMTTLMKLSEIERLDEHLNFSELKSVLNRQDSLLQESLLQAKQNLAAMEPSAEATLVAQVVDDLQRRQSPLLVWLLEDELRAFLSETRKRFLGRVDGQKVQAEIKQLVGRLDEYCKLLPAHWQGLPALFTDLHLVIDRVERSRNSWRSLLLRLAPVVRQQFDGFTAQAVDESGGLDRVDQLVASRVAQLKAVIDARGLALQESFDALTGALRDAKSPLPMGESPGVAAADLPNHDQSSNDILGVESWKALASLNQTVQRQEVLENGIRRGRELLSQCAQQRLSEVWDENAPSADVRNLFADVRENAGAEMQRRIEREAMTEFAELFDRLKTFGRLLFAADTRLRFPERPQLELLLGVQDVEQGLIEDHYRWVVAVRQLAQAMSRPLELLTDPGALEAFDRVLAEESTVGNKRPVAGLVFILTGRLMDRCDKLIQEVRHRKLFGGKLPTFDESQQPVQDVIRWVNDRIRDIETRDGTASPELGQLLKDQGWWRPRHAGVETPSPTSCQAAGRGQTSSAEKATVSKSPLTNCSPQN